LALYRRCPNSAYKDLILFFFDYLKAAAADIALVDRGFIVRLYKAGIFTVAFRAFNRRRPFRHNFTPNSRLFDRVLLTESSSLEIYFCPCFKNNSGNFINLKLNFSEDKVFCCFSTITLI
jgi:hypothetical protein